MNTYKVKQKRRKKIKPVEKISPEQQLLFDELCEIAQKLGIEVKIESGRFNGGYCVVDKEAYIYLNKDFNMDAKIEMLTTQLKNLNLDKVFISPKLRDYLNMDEI